MPQPGGSQAAGVYRLEVWRPGDCNQGIGSRDVTLLKVLGEDLSCLLQRLLAAGVPRHSLACRCASPTWACAPTCTSVCPFLSRKDTATHSAQTPPNYVCKTPLLNKGTPRPEIPGGQESGGTRLNWVNVYLTITFCAHGTEIHSPALPPPPAKEAAADDT